jgi:D-aminopeptidase
VTGGRVRARELGIVVGSLPPGPGNAITDVPGVLVGHTTLVSGDDIRTGVTAVVPVVLRGRERLPAAVAVGNGFGKMVGTTQLRELGVIETPVVLTSTLATFRAADAVLTYLRDLPGNEQLGTVNPVVAETNDQQLSDIWQRPVTEQHVLAALRGASAGPVAEGAVGAGTGTGALGYKAGIGTASRTMRVAGRAVTIGALVQANFGGTLTVLGVPLPAGPTLRAAGIELPPGKEGHIRENEVIAATPASSCWPPTRRWTRASLPGWPGERSSAWPGQDRPSRAAAATTRWHSPPAR